MDKWDNQIVRNSYEDKLDTEQCMSIIQLLHKIQDIVKFFKANLADYQKAEEYLRRYENLRERTLAIV